MSKYYCSHCYDAKVKGNFDRHLKEKLNNIYKISKLTNVNIATRTSSIIRLCVNTLNIPRKIRMKISRTCN